MLNHLLSFFKEIKRRVRTKGRLKGIGMGVRNWRMDGRKEMKRRIEEGNEKTEGWKRKRIKIKG